MIHRHLNQLFKPFILLGLFLLRIFVANSAPMLPETNLSWKNVTVADKKTTVLCFYMDSRGIMWIGTNSGLYFYDGVTTHPMGGNDLYGTQIYDITEYNGTLYLGSDNGILEYSYEKGIISQSMANTPKEIRTIRLIDDVLWIGGLNGISRLNLKDNTIVDCSKGLPHKSVYSIIRDSRGIIYVGTYEGLARWDSTLESFKTLKPHDSNNKRSSLLANCLLESIDRNKIYVGGEGSFYAFYPATEKWEKISEIDNTVIKCLSHGRDGHVLVGTDNGVFELNGSNIHHYRHDARQELSIADNEIWCIFYDSNHNVWAGHERGFSIAANSQTLRTVKISNLTHSGEGNEIHSIHRDIHGNLWFGGTNGLIKISGSDDIRLYQHSELPSALSHNRIRKILEDANHNMWFATDAGINKYNRENGNFEIFHVVDAKGEHKTNWVYSIVEDGKFFWIGSFLTGIHHVNKALLKNNTNVMSDFALNSDVKTSSGKPFSNNLVNDMVKDSQGNLWILHFRDNTLTKYHHTTHTMVKYDIYKLTGGYPTNISADKKGRIWCAFKGGVIIFNANNKPKILYFPQTNSDETILSMGKVRDGMWIATQSNVWNINGDSLKAELLPIPQKSYTAIYEDWLSHKVYLGGIDEIVEVDADAFSNSVKLKDINIIIDYNGNGNLNLSDIKKLNEKTIIPYGGSFTLVVSTLNYSPESAQRYMYKLSDTTKDTNSGWIVLPEGSNTITFSELKMGEYAVLIKTVGSPMEPIAVPLKVNPPMVLSWWAICFYVLVAAFIIYWVIWYVRKRNQRSFQEKERQNALENAERKLTFLTTISHDLKTPLSMIMGPVSLMKEKAKDPESKKSLETIYDNAVRLNNMIHRTLELQQIEDNGENLLILSIFNVVEFSKGVFEVFKENNPQKKFVFHTSHSQILVEVDAVKFESVITNLLSNACKYSDEGATISCGINKLEGRVEIIVSDDGIGIAEIEKKLVFQRMFRSPSTAKIKEGTGLGLYLIKKYLDLMGGDIDLYSKEGEGTSFVVSLPISERSIPKARKENHEESNDKQKILIVEDNLQISNFIAEILSDKYTLITAENGRSGLAIAASFLPDLIIVDEMMPIMNGLEMVKRIKQHSRLSSVPIIMLTAKTDNKTENESIKLGIDVFMSKPFEPTALLGRIKHLLKGRLDIKETVRIQTIVEAEEKPIEAESINEKNLAKIAKIIEENISNPELNVNLLCDKSGIPNKQLYRLIKKYMGTSPVDYIRRVRLQKAAVLLSQDRFTISEISYMVGFNTPSYFAKCFQNQYGVTPSQYKSDETV